MKNAHLRMGKLTFVRQTRDTVTDVSPSRSSRGRATAGFENVDGSASGFSFRGRSGGRRHDRSCARRLAIPDWHRGAGVHRLARRKARRLPGLATGSRTEASGPARDRVIEDILRDDVRREK